MSNAPRPATWNTRSRSCAGHVRELGQRMSASPSLAGASVVPHSGHVRRHHEFALGAVAHVDHRTEHLGDDVAGLADHDGVADQHALALDLRGVVQRGQPDRRPGDLDRLHVGERRDPPGAPDVDPDVEQLGGGLLRRVLVGDRPPRRARRRAEPALQRDVVDFDHQAVDLVLDVVAVLAPVGDALGDRVDARDRVVWSDTGSPHAFSAR